MLRRWFTSASIYLVGETVANWACDRPSDHGRTLRATAMGATGDAILLRGFQGIVERRVPNPLLRTMAEQLVYSPLSNGAYLTVARGGMGWTLKDWWRVYRNDCAFWPMASYIGYRFVPFHVRYLYVSGCSLLWGTWRSTIVSNG